MIHRVEVTHTTTFEELKKEVRKKLMTGGAVVRLQPGLSSDQLEVIRGEFEPHRVKFGLAEEVIREIETQKTLS